METKKRTIKEVEAELAAEKTAKETLRKEAREENDALVASLKEARAELRASKDWQTVKAQNEALRRQMGALQAEVKARRAQLGIDG